jgi:hypothetical protein
VTHDGRNLQRGVARVVKEFVGTRLSCEEDVDALALLIRTSDRWWDAEALGRELRLTVAASRGILERLASRNLLAIRITGDVRYQFHPGEPAILQAAEAFAQAYATQRSALARLTVRSRQRQRSAASKRH